MPKTSHFVLHAPNVHSGGGLVLLQSLLSVPDLVVKLAQLDQRAKQQLPLPADTLRHDVYRSVLSRMSAEWRLWRSATADDVVLCFHGLPPLFHLRGHVVVFVQNRLLFNSYSLQGYPFLTRLRLMGERWWTRIMSRNCDRYIVQTPSMAAAVRHCLGQNADVTVLPFIVLTKLSNPENFPVYVKKFDFVYVASGDAHKNHNNLLEAWRVLADAAQKPSLVLTVNPETFPELAGKIAKYVHLYGLSIVNFGGLSTMDVTSLYQASSALIYPSQVESFGLPLIEAAQQGLPVLAPELDYVRDVIQPVETFDPNSPVSIARAVGRFLGNPETTVQIRSAEEFLAEVLR